MKLFSKTLRSPKKRIANFRNALVLTSLLGAFSLGCMPSTKDFEKLRPKIEEARNKCNKLKKIKPFVWLMLL